MPSQFAVSGSSVSGTPIQSATTPRGGLMLGSLGCCCETGGIPCQCFGCAVPLKDLTMDIDPPIFIGREPTSTLTLKNVGGGCLWQASLGVPVNFFYAFSLTCDNTLRAIVFSVNLRTSGLSLTCSTPNALKITSQTCGDAFDMKVAPRTFTSCSIFTDTTFHIHT